MAQQTGEDVAVAEEAAVNEKVLPKGLEGPRDVLKVLGISKSMWESLEDGVPLQSQETELLLRLIFSLRMFQPTDFEAWKQPPPDWHTLAPNSLAWRGRLFEVQGIAEALSEENVPPELAERMGLVRYYLVQLTTEGKTKCLVYCRDVPRAWKRMEKLREKTVVRGLFLKLWETEPAPVPVLVTHRPAWFPDTLLGKLGMDYSLFDDVQLEASTERFVNLNTDSPADTETLADPLERYRLTGKDRECFYQLLAAVTRAQPGELLQEAKKELARQGKTMYSVVPLFNDAPNQQAKLFALFGTARRIEQITVDDPDIRNRFGIDHYYTIYLFTDDSQNYPIVFCVRFLPEGVVPGEGPGYTVNLAVAGFFMKTWAFRPHAVLSPSAPRNTWQLAPLLIGREASRWTPETTARRVGTVTTFLAGSVVVIVALIGFMVWWFNRRDESRKRQLLQRLASSEPSFPPSSGDVASSDTNTP